jgi:hypothetical protein
MVASIINYIILSCSGMSIYTIFCSIIYCFKQKKTPKYNIIDKNKYRVKLYKQNNIHHSYSIFELDKLNKNCFNKRCNKYLPLYSSWYCYDGNIYCSSECRLYAYYSNTNTNTNTNNNNIENF